MKILLLLKNWMLFILFIITGILFFNTKGRDNYLFAGAMLFFLPWAVAVIEYGRAALARSGTKKTEKYLWTIVYIAVITCLIVIESILSEFNISTPTIFKAVIGPAAIFTFVPLALLSYQVSKTIVALEEKGDGDKAYTIWLTVLIMFVYTAAIWVQPKVNEVFRKKKK